MLAIILSIVIVIIFPIFINGKFYFTKDKSKLFYTIKLFNVVTVINGYLEIEKNEMILHLTKRKAVIIPFSSLFEIRKKIKPLKDYHLIRANLHVKIGEEDNELFPLSIAFVCDYIVNFIRWFLFHSKPYFNINSAIDVYQEKDVFKVYFEGTVVFNLLMILLSLIKILTEKLFYAFTKQQN